MLRVLFEDDQILAIHKPSGTASHIQMGSNELSCEAILKEQLPTTSTYLLHRLDTGTSGVLLFGKSDAVYNEMREKFKLKQIRKVYRAWSALDVEKASQVKRLHFPHRIELPLAHHPKSKKRMMAIPPDKHRSFRGKPIPALSILHSIVESDFNQIPAFEIEIEIVTGVMHQIRVHLDSIGFPILGDKIYGAKNDTDIRMALHAERISFELRGFRYEISSRLDSDD